MIQLKKIDKVLNNGQTRTFKVLRRRPLHPIIANKFVSHTLEVSVIGRNIRYINKLCEVQIDVDSTDCNKLGFIYTRKIQPLTASTDRGRTGRTDACTLQKARGRESRGDFNFRGVEVEEGETPPAAVGRTAEGEGDRKREERTLERREKSARAADFTGTERHRARGRARQRTEDPFCGAIGASKIKYLLARPRLPHSLVSSDVCRFLLSDHTWSWPPTTSRLPNPRLPLSPPVCRLVRPRFQSAVLVFGSRDDRVGREGNSQNLARPSLGPRSFPLPSPAHLVRVNGWRPHNNSVGNVTIHSLGRDDAGRDGEGHTTTIYIETLNGRDQEICCTRRRGGVTLAQMENFCYGQEDVSAFHRISNVCHFA